MSKDKNSNKKSGNQPPKTVKEKKQTKQAKREKKREEIITHESPTLG